VRVRISLKSEKGKQIIVGMYGSLYYSRWTCHFSVVDIEDIFVDCFRKTKSLKVWLIFIYA